MPVPISSFAVDGRAVYSIALKDRTQRPHRNKTWLYKNQLEAAVYGPRETSNGALNKLLGRLSMNNSALLLNASAVEEGIVTEAEFTQIITHFQTNVLLSDAKGKAKNVSLVPTSVASAASQAYGRTPRTVELLRGLSALPRTWRLEEERDALAAQGEEDLALEDEIENEEIDETLVSSSPSPPSFLDVDQSLSPNVRTWTLQWRSSSLAVPFMSKRLRKRSS